MRWTNLHLALLRRRFKEELSMGLGRGVRGLYGWAAPQPGWLSREPETRTTLSGDNIRLTERPERRHRYLRGEPQWRRGDRGDAPQCQLTPAAGPDGP
jgi:hypothetical protein